MVNYRNTKFAAALILSLLSGSQAFAAKATRSSNSSSSSSDSSANVPVSGSIASPGATTATFTNPAGLVSGNGARLSLQGGSPDPMSDPNYRALLLYGGGILGASAGIDYSMRSGSGTDRGYAVYGLALHIPVVDFTLGVSGRTGIKDAEGSDYNLGVLLSPTPFVKIGGTAKGLQGRADSYGVGVGFNLLGGVDLVADAGFDPDLKNGEFKPGIKIASSFAALSLSYGTGTTAQFSKDFSGAVFLRVGSNSELEFEYNHGGEIPKYYGSLSFGF